MQAGSLQTLPALLCPKAASGVLLAILRHTGKAGAALAARPSATAAAAHHRHYQPPIAALGLTGCAARSPWREQNAKFVQLGQGGRM